jgi:hypothetical protein
MPNAVSACLNRIKEHVMNFTSKICFRGAFRLHLRRRPSTFALLAVVILAATGTTGPVFAMIPWFAQDVYGDLRNSPEMVRLIGENATVFLENIANPPGTGDTFDFQDPNVDPQVALYTNATCLSYEGAWWYSGGKLHSEDAYYHSADPSLLHVWRDSATSAFLRWDDDYRFVPIAQLGSSPPNVSYRIMRRLNTASPWQEVAANVTGQSYLDSDLRGCA